MINNNNFNADILYDTVFENAEFYVIVLGGNSEEHINFTSKDRKKIGEIITNNSTFSEKNQGIPIAYTSAFLKENRIATIKSSTEYIETTSTKYQNGKITLKHTGGYIAEFYVTWKERRYVNGKAVDTEKSWDKNGKNLTAPFSTEISIPANAFDLHVKAQGKTGLAWEKWRTSIDQDLSLHPNIKVSIWGTTLKQKGEVTYN